MGNLVIFEVWLLINRVVNVAETFPDILNIIFFKRMLLNLQSVCCKEVP